MEGDARMHGKGDTRELLSPREKGKELISSLWMDPTDILIIADTNSTLASRQLWPVPPAAYVSADSNHREQFDIQRYERYSIRSWQCDELVPLEQRVSGL